MTRRFLLVIALLPGSTEVLSQMQFIGAVNSAN
jgi:hypothetical protein